MEIKYILCSSNFFERELCNTFAEVTINFFGGE